jgi:hypothetical protein
MSQVILNLFQGKDKYAVGLLFMLGNLANFFLHMKNSKIPDSTSFSILFFLIILSRHIPV